MWVQHVPEERMASTKLCWNHLVLVQQQGYQCSSSGVDEVKADYEVRETLELIKLIVEMLVSTFAPGD